MAWIDIKDYLAVSHPAVEAVDYVVAEGTSGGWTWKKWNSGKAECWTMVGINYKAAEQWGSTYCSQHFFSTYPFEFLKINNISATQISGRGQLDGIVILGIGDSYQISNKEIEFYVSRPTALADGTGGVSLFITGKWKQFNQIVKV